MTDWRKFVRQVAPHADPAIAAGVIKTADTVTQKYNLLSIARQSDFFAHVLVESAGLTKLEENLNYSAQRLMQVWPNRFPSVAAAEPYAHNPKALAIKVYGGRMGNRPGTDDGWTFRGSGPLQNTGRDNIERLADHLGISVEECAQWLRDPDHALECAAAMYVMLGAVPFADRGDIEGSCRRINGGTTGLPDRKRARELCTTALRQQSAAVGFVDMPGDQNADLPASRILAAQRLLREKGYFGIGQPDGVMGPATKAAIYHFQSDNGLPATGELDQATQDTLYVAQARTLPDSRTDASVDDLRAKGSETIASADGVQRNAGKMVAAASTGALGAGLDVVTGLTDKVQKISDATSAIDESKAFLAQHWMAAMLLVGACLLIWWAWQNHGASKLIKRIRVAEHRTGRNMGR